MKNKLCLAVVIISMAALVVLFAFGIASLDTADTFGMSVTRACGTVAFIAFIIRDGTRVWRSRPSFGKALLYSLPAFAVAVNNFPIIPFLSGSVTVDAPPVEILALALECFLIGAFEETAFRGIILMSVLSRFSETKKQVFLSLVITSAAFGFVHIFNLLAGAGIVPTLQQVGYSFLIGGMCGIVLLKTHSLPLAIIIHSLYDFCGFIVPRLGSGRIWTAPEIVLTVIVAVIVFAFYVREAFKLTTEDADF